MERMRWVLLGVAIAVAPGVMTGMGGGVVLFMAGAAGLVLVGGGVVRPRARRRHEAGWEPAGGFAFVPSTGHVPASAWEVGGALGRAEARQLFPGSLAFCVGVGFSLVTMVLFGVIWAGDHGGETAAIVEWFPIMVHPLAGMTVVAVHRARTRGRRDGVEELFGSCPATDATRDVAHLRTAWLPALAAATTVLVLLGCYWLRVDLHWGPFGARQAAHVAGSALLAAGAVALGVVLARWAPWQLAPVVAVAAIGLVSLRLAESGGSTSDGAVQLSTIVVSDEADLRFTAPHWLAHHLWVAGLVLVTVAVALLRDRGDRRRVGAVLAVAAVGAAVTGYAATRPIDHDDAVRIAALIADPAAHQSCAGVDIPICTYDGDGALVGSFAPHVAAVLAGAPAGAVPDGVLLRQGADVDRAVLDPHVAALLPADPPADGVLPVALTHNDDAHEAARFWVALAVIGVRNDHQAGEVVDLRGQARGVVALWLATRDLPGDRAHDMSSVSPAGGPEHAWEAARPWPDVDVAGPIPVVWALTDLEAARRLIAAPEAELRSALHAGWSEFTDPESSTDDLLAVLGLEPVGPPQGSTPRTSP
jgi:hypothetical protein